MVGTGRGAIKIKKEKHIVKPLVIPQIQQAPTAN